MKNGGLFRNLCEQEKGTDLVYRYASSHARSVILKECGFEDDQTVFEVIIRFVSRLGRALVLRAASVSAKMCSILCARGALR
jgi:hypothetical protein